MTPHPEGGGMTGARVKNKATQKRATFAPITLAECNAFEKHASSKDALITPFGFPPDCYVAIQPYDLSRFVMTVRRLHAAINEACGIIEIGDQRLLAGDGPAGSLPPDISLAEWRRMYVVLSAARGVK